MAPSGREAKKQDKRRRIREAAAALFRERGWEGTTTRAIAERAAIATGTLFLYVRDKDEALALVYGEEVDAALASGSATRPRRARFVAGVAHRLRPLYALYAEHPDLALRFVRRIPTLEDAEKVEHEARNERFLAVVRDEVVRAVATGELRADLDVALASRTLFAVVRMQVFAWLASAAAPGGASRPSVDAGLAELGATLDLLSSGLGSPRAVARPPRAARRPGRAKRTSA